MHWLALQWPQPDPTVAAPAELPSREALAWWALGFTPHVVWLEEALLLEVSACERLWGGRRALLQRVLRSNPASTGMQRAQASTSLVALGRLRWLMEEAVPAKAATQAGQAALASRQVPEPADLPLHTLSAARPHLGVLTRLGCRNWGQVDALPRAGLVRRFGPELGRALDVAFGRAPDSHAWITPPERFEQSLELPERADSAPALLWSARRLLQTLQLWLAARLRGVLALELAWTFDQRRIDGRVLPPEDAITLRTAAPVQGMAHIQRLLAERLARTALAAPVRAIRLRVLEMAPWQPDTASFLPEEQARGEPWHVFIERVGARLGAGSVRVPVLREDHRPECRQAWRSAEQTLRRPSLHSTASLRRKEEAHRWPAHLPDALGPTWLLRPPQPLTVQGGQPCHQGQRLRLIAGPHRIEAGWWSNDRQSMPASDDEAPVARDYFIAQSPAAELLWVYRERPMSSPTVDHAPRWFLHGLYA